MKKRKKYRANVKHFVDQDYKDKLNDKDSAWLDKFNGEYYANEINRKDSIHSTSLSTEEFARAKKETYGATNSQNRDIYGIAATSSNYLKFIDDENNLIEPTATDTISRIEDPQRAFNVFLEEMIDEITNSAGRDLKVILIEYGVELVKLGASLRKDRINATLKKKDKK